MWFQDLNSILTWWLALFAIGLIALPLTSTLFKNWWDRGYPLTKTTGLILMGYLNFLLAHLGLPFTSSSVALVFLLAAIVSLYWAKTVKFSFKNRRLLITFLLQELLFLLLLAIWATVRGFAPDIHGLEKFMDFGFVNAILNSPHFPPHDIWLSASSINYYYFGHYLTAWLTQLTHIPSSITYNLMLATLFAASFTSVLSLTSNLIFAKSHHLRIALIGGLLAATLLTTSGNLHAVIYGLKSGFDHYWYPDATRFIGYNPDIPDKTIHEFPLYSFVVSDLHAHLIDLPIVLLFLSLLFQSIFFFKPAKLFTPSSSLPLAFTLGIMYMTNSWDFAIYLLAAGLVISLTLLTHPHLSPQKLLTTFISWLLTVAASLLIALPFILNFHQIAQGIAFVSHHTPLWQLLVLWGFPLFSVLSFFIFLAFKIIKTKSSSPLALSSLPKSDIFVAGLALTGLILLAIPEIIFVKDIYITSYQRANTMFKLTYQAFVIFAAIAGYILTRLARTKLLPAPIRFLWTLVFLTGVFSVMLYPQTAISSYYNHLKNYKGLSGTTWLSRDYPEDSQAINWIIQNTPPSSIIQEAAGDSYTDYARISVHTGRSTVIGWLVHEWLWRGSFDEPGKRAEDVRLIYESPDLAATKNLLTKYHVDYVAIGGLEKDKYPKLNLKKFSQNYKTVFTTGSTQIYQITP